MSRNTKSSKKSTSKYSRFKISPLIPIVAIVEVIILVAISTFAWFSVSQEKETNTGIITVDADSGLDIDFKNANYDDSINIWNYVNEDFKFEPATSLDGRNIYFPTSGTFDSTSTNGIKFREGTINDINTKYLDIDFALTNTTANTMNVYLNNNSYFYVHDKTTDERTTSRALRLAFYTNDGNHGNVNSTLLTNTNNENAILSSDTSSFYTVYFEKPSAWNDVYAYVWKNESSTVKTISEWPGSQMTRLAGNIYSYTFKNTDGYNKIVFNKGQKDNNHAYDGSTYTESNATQTRDLTITNGNKYSITLAADNGGSAYTTRTVYFRKPSAWSQVKAHVFVSAGNETALTSWPGDFCTDLGADIYSFTFPEKNASNQTYAYIIFNDGGSNQTPADGLSTGYVNASGNAWSSGTKYSPLYYFSAANDGSCDRKAYKESTIYFQNTKGWTDVRVKMTTDTSHTTEVAMTKLSGNIWYATIPSVYTSIAFEEGAGQTNATYYTRSISTTDGYLYTPESSSSSGWSLTYFSYNDYAVGGSYAVISPGVSAGFQRSYSPVVNIAGLTGDATEVVPAFASSIDNYIYGSGAPLFTIPSYGMLDLSMIVWLEGTDPECDNDYAANLIELYLEFSTTLTVNNVETDYVSRENAADTYTYRFYDGTREVWTSDRITSSSGVSVAPVMQLYDATDGRGYLMHAASTTDVNGSKKVDIWECNAPQFLVTDTDGAHDLYFRRVNPYNEDEVWNYWHPGYLKTGDDHKGTLISEASSTLNGRTYINFTAFADGAMASGTDDKPGSGSNTAFTHAVNAGAPAASCGGLWGKYTTSELVLVDGTDGLTLKNGGTDKTAVTICYNYHYPTSGVNQTIEYKASGPYYNGIYYFVIPSSLENGSGLVDTMTVSTKKNGALSFESLSGVYFAFKHYTGFNDKYALNKPGDNPNIKFDYAYSFTSNMTGLYAQINYDDNSDANFYWGDDIWYYQIKKNSPNFFEAGAKLVAGFNGGSAKYFFMHTSSSNNNNDSFHGDDGNYWGFAAVVPEGSGTSSNKGYLARYWSQNLAYNGTINNANANFSDKDFYGPDNNLFKADYWQDGKMHISWYNVNSWP